MQHVVWPAFWNAGIQRLQTGAHTGDGAVVVGALLVHHALKTTLPFVEVVGYVRNKVGVTAVFFAHYAVFVITEIGGAQPQCAAVFVGVAIIDQGFYGGFHFAFAVQGRLEEIHIEIDGKGF